MGGARDAGAGAAEPRPVVVHVEDADAVRRLVRAMLEPAGWRVLEARSGGEALALLGEQVPDAVLLDVQLPDADGFELCRRIRSDPRTAELPVIYLSAAHVQDEDRVAGLEHGGDAYLTHPVRPRVLVATLHAAVRARRAEAALRRSEQRLRVMLDSLPDAVVLVDAQGRIRLLNPAAERLFGYTAAELGGQPVEVLVPEPLREAHRAHRERFARRPEARPEVARTLLSARRRDGSIVPVEIGLGPLPGGEVVAAVRDISERIRAEHTLHRIAQAVNALTGEPFFAGLVCELAGAVGAHYAAVLRFEDGSRGRTLAAWEDGAPAPPEEFSLDGAPCLEVIRRREICLWASGARESFPNDHFLTQHGIEALAEAPLIASDGRVLGGLTAMYREPIRDPDRVVAILRILAGRAAAELDRLRAEEDLRRAEAELRSLFDNAVEGIFRASPDGRLTVLNPAIREILGVGDHPAGGVGLAPFGEECWAEIRERVERDGKLMGFVCCVEGGSPRWIEVNARALRDPHGKLVAIEGFVTDVTRQHRLQEQLLQAQKMEAIGRLAGGVAHDFNNLLFVIGGYARMLQSRVGGDEVAARAAGEIVAAAERASALTSRLLAFARRQPMELAPVDLDALLEGMRDMLQRLLGEDVRLEMRLGAAPCRVLADPAQLEQVVANLAVNARDAMPHGGVLSLTTSALPPDGEPQASGYVWLTVSDTGVGIPRELQDRIFEPFFTTKDEKKGTGLGLATVYGIVEQCGGRIQVESEPGRGATFRIGLRMAGSEARPAGESRGPRAADGGSVQGRVLLVEDEPAVRELVAQVLREAGAQVEVAENAEEAIEVFRRAGPFDVLVTDVIMPGMNGRELAERLRAGRDDLPVLFLSGYSGDVLEERAGLDAAAILSKPVSPERLVNALRQALAACSAAGER